MVLVGIIAVGFDSRWRYQERPVFAGFFCSPGPDLVQIWSMPDKSGDSARQRRLDEGVRARMKPLGSARSSRRSGDQSDT